MRQETGSNTHNTQNIVSIRITSSGHNFSFDSESSHSQVDVTLLIETHKAMLVPTSLLDENSATEHLLAAGINLNEPIEESVVVRYDDITSAIIVMPTSLMSEIRGVYGGRVKFTTPLLIPARTLGHEVQIRLSEDRGLLTLSLFNGGDRLFAEVFEVNGIADILYWLTRLSEGYDLTDYTIYIDGWGRELQKLLKNYYKSVVICE